MTTDPPRGDVTCGTCGLTVTADTSERTGGFASDGTWTCRVCLLGGLEVALDYLRRLQRQEEDGQ